MRRHSWSDQETTYLESTYYTKPIKDIASELNLTYQQVVTKAHNIGLNRKKETGELWTKEEDDFLVENFEYASKGFLERHLPKRKWAGIYLRGSKRHLLERKSQDKYDVNHLSFSEWSESTAYIVGFILADGYLKHNHGERNESSLQLELADYDEDILLKIKQYTNFQGPIRRSKRGTVVLNISNKKIIEDLIAKGIPKKEKTLKGKWLKDVPQEHTNHFVRGLFDGDGSVYRKNGKMCIQFLGTEDVIKGISQNSPANKKTFHFRGNKEGPNIYCLYYSSKEDVKKVYEWLYKDATIFSDRKFEKFQEFL